jgi:large conductance mechanosensitive channel
MPPRPSGKPAKEYGRNPAAPAPFRPRCKTPSPQRQWCKQTHGHGQAAGDRQRSASGTPGAFFSRSCVITGPGTLYTCPTMGFVQEFKEFALKGNAIELAVGVVIGGAFGKIVNSMVADLINPLLGLLTRGVNLADKWVALDGNTYASIADAKKAGAAVLTYGNFLNSVIEFILIALAIFIVIKQINRLVRVSGDNLPK